MTQTLNKKNYEIAVVEIVDSEQFKTKKPLVYVLFFLNYS